MFLLSDLEQSGPFSAVIRVLRQLYVAVNAAHYNVENCRRYEPPLPMTACDPSPRSQRGLLRLLLPWLSLLLLLSPLSRFYPPKK